MTPNGAVEPILCGCTTSDRPSTTGPTDAKWHVLWTRSHCEELVCDQLAAKGFELFLPKVEVWSRRRGVRRLIRTPMFSGYAFLHHAMEKQSYIEVCKARGLVGMLGQGWNQLATVPDAEIEAIQKVVFADLPAFPCPHLRQGQRVRITRGPLADVEGILVQTKANKGLLVLSVELLQRSVAVEVDCTSVVPVGALARAAGREERSRA